jgi:hypothetical protein
MEMGFCRLNQPYSPELVRQEAFGSPAAAFALALRAVRMGLEVGSFFARVYLDNFTGGVDDGPTVQRRAVQLRDSLTRLGPTFIKAGQVLANRPDIMREDYMNELCVLQVCGAVLFGYMRHIMCDLRVARQISVYCVVTIELCIYQIISSSTLKRYIEGSS